MKSRNNLLMAIIILLTAGPVFAEVWKTENYWDENFEEQYGEWIQSEEVHKDIFTSRTSPYYGVRADCADVVYALRAIFSYENRLLFKVKNSRKRQSSRKYKFITNELDKWDDHRAGPKRVVAFINYIGRSFGTEKLAANDSFPIKLSTITPGNIFMYKHKTFRGSVRHAYNLKDVNPDGTFAVIYSTQQIAAAKRSLRYSKRRKLSNRPKLMNWGFKAIRWHYEDEIISERRRYGLEQYRFAQEMSDGEFFDHVQNLLKTVDETSDAAVSRVLDDICEQAKDRIINVQEAIDFQKTTRGRCMDYTEYDIYSTPNRDRALKSAINELRRVWKKIQVSELVGLVSRRNVFMTEASLTEDLSETQEELLLEFCPLNYKKFGSSLTLNFLIKKLDLGEISFHPNDNIDRRWGVLRGAKTRCKQFYD